MLWLVTTSDSDVPVPSPSAAPATGQGSVASLVLGLLSLIAAPILIGLILGLIAIYLGGRRDPHSGISIAGRILGIIAVVIAVLLAIARGIAAVNA